VPLLVAAAAGGGGLALALAALREWPGRRGPTPSCGGSVEEAEEEPEPSWPWPPAPPLGQNRADALLLQLPPALAQSELPDSNVRRDDLLGLPFGAVIHFTNCYADVDLLYPWRVHEPKVATGTGFSIGGRRIVTNHHVIKSCTSIRLQRHGVPGNYEARVLISSALCDLALVTVDDNEFWKDLPTCKMQEAVPELDDTVVAVGYPLDATTVTLTRGVVSNVHLKDLSLTELNEMQLTIQIDAAINPGNSGGPVFNQVTHEVVGVAFAGLQNAEGHGYIIPTSVLRNFIRVFEATGEFTALPSLGLRVQGLGNPSMRKRAFDGLPTHHHGVIVTALAPFSCAKQAGVCVGDVLMSVDSSPVSEEAQVVFRGHELVHYSYLYTQKGVGDIVRLSLLRRNDDGNLETVEIDVPLTAGKYFVSRELWKDYCPDYLIVGGLVLLIAGLPLMQQLESQGRFGPRHAAIMLAEQDSDDVDDPEAQPIIVGDCLAHEVNVGYQLFIGQRLEKIDGTKVRNLTHAASLLCSAVAKGTPFIELRFNKFKPIAVFETTALLAATITILMQHKIPSLSSFPLELAPAKANTMPPFLMA